MIGDDGLSVGPVTVSFLDADTLVMGDHRVTLGLWPGGSLELSQMGRRFDAFSGALRHARNQARVAGFLCHAPELPEIFTGALLGDGAPLPAEFQVYGTHVTIVPDGGDPWQIPLGAVHEITREEDPPVVVLARERARTKAGWLARRRDAFHDAVVKARAAQLALLAAYAGQPGFSDGAGVPRARVKDFDALLARCASAERLEGARVLLGKGGSDARLGFVKLLDPDDGGSAAGEPLPKDWASFLLVPVKHRVVLELLAGPSAATYVFEGAIEDINRDLQLLHFRRAGLALSEDQARITPENPHRLALRCLDPLKRLRAATRARIVHNDGWAAALAGAL